MLVKYLLSGMSFTLLLYGYRVLADSLFSSIFLDAEFSGLLTEVSFWFSTIVFFCAAISIAYEAGQRSQKEKAAQKEDHQVQAPRISDSLD